MGLYIYKITVAEKNTLNKDEDYITDNNMSNINNKDNVIQDEDATKMAKKTLDKYIKLHNYENNNIGPIPYILVELGLETEEEIDLLCKDTTDPTVYIKSNTKYEDFRETLLQYVTEDYFKENFSQYKNIDGYVGFCNCATSTTVLEVQNMTLTSKDEKNYIFDVTFKDVEMYEHYLNGEEISEDDYLFNTKISFEYIDNNLVIFEF